MSVIAACVAIAWWLREPRNSGQQAPIRITRDGLAQSPKISRDGKLLCYTSRAGGEKMHIWVRQIAGGESMQVTRGLDDETQPDICPMVLKSLSVRSERGAVFTLFQRSVVNHDCWPQAATVHPFPQTVRKYFSLLAGSIPQPTSSRYKVGLRALCVRIG